MGKHVPDDWGTVASSGYGLMVVKMTDYAADAEQTALSGASRRPRPSAKRCASDFYHGRPAIMADPQATHFRTRPHTPNSGGANPSIMAGAIPTRPLLTANSTDA